MTPEAPLFYLGTHETSWLRRADAPVPLFVSHRRLRRLKRLYRSTHRWALDSGGFTEISMFGRWVTTAAEYAAAVMRYDREVGLLDWAAPMDWMCEPHMLVKTGLTIREHQQRTIASVVELRRLVKGVNIIPVLQGWSVADYHAHAEMYAAAGFDLAAESTVGVGSVCRRQALAEGEEIFRSLAGRGLRLHGFGAKGQALQRYGAALASCDSLAWSFAGRRRPDPNCEKASCANCLHYALAWRAQAIAAGPRTLRQPYLFSMWREAPRVEGNSK